MLNSRLGVLMYMILRNDLVWHWLSEEEKKIILNANKKHNIGREDYKNPEEYGKGRVNNGENWDSPIDRSKYIRGRILSDILDKIKPNSVLELGPGAGFYTKAICGNRHVNEYCGIDIGKAFLDYLAPRLDSLKNVKSGFKYELICDDFENLKYPNRFNLIVLLSTVHHIPNRVELFKKLSNMLAPDGRVLCIDPSHYLFRLYTLIRKMPQQIYNCLTDRTNLSTHPFCSRGEYGGIAANLRLYIEDEWYFNFIPRRYFKHEFVRGNTWMKLFSREMAILFKKLSLSSDKKGL